MSKIYYFYLQQFYFLEIDINVEIMYYNILLIINKLYKSISLFLGVISYVIIQGGYPEFLNKNIQYDD